MAFVNLSVASDVDTRQLRFGAQVQGFPGIAITGEYDGDERKIELYFRACRSYFLASLPFDQYKIRADILDKAAKKIDGIAAIERIRALTC